MSEFRVRADGTRVVLIKDGQLTAILPWEAALQLSRALHVQAKRAEEWAKQDRVIGDQALLCRLGVKLGLIRDPRLRPAAVQRALHDRDLRRYVPQGRVVDAMGTPTVEGSP